MKKNGLFPRVGMLGLMLFAGSLASSPTAIRAEPGSAAAAFHVVGYLPSYRAAEFDPKALGGITDLVLFAAEPSAAGGLELKHLKEMPWERLREFKTRSRVRLILCIGGWGKSDHFASVATSHDKRRAFAKAALQQCQQQHLDGIDIDWEHPKDAAEEAGYGKLLTDLKEALHPHGLRLSVAMAGWQGLPAEGIKAVDTVNLMAYDMAARHSTFEGAEADVKRLLEHGIPARKIVLGMPFYGREIKNRDRAMTYREIVASHHPAANVDEVAGVYFNGPAMIRRKTSYAMKSGLGGVMIWEVGQDAKGADSLLQVIHSTIHERPK